MQDTFRYLAARDFAQQGAGSACGFRLFEHTEETLPDLARFLACIDAFPDARLLVVSHHWRGLVMVCDEALLEGVGVIV